MRGDGSWRREREVGGDPVDLHASLDSSCERAGSYWGYGAEKAAVIQLVILQALG